LKSVAIVTGIYGVPTAIGIASTYYSFKILQMNYETAKLNLEAATEAASLKS
jgi:arginine/ornithine N-succinyltransferase beta subunit